MTITLSSSGINTSSGVLKLSDGSKQITLKTGKIIETNSYISCGTYVFKKGIDIPLVYFTQRRSTSGTNGSFIYNTTTDTVSNVSGVAYTKITPGYISALKSVIAYASSVTFKMSQVVSNVGYSSSIGSTESSRFNSSLDFVSSNYSLANPAPTVRGNLETLSNSSNAYNSGSVSGKNITITCKTNNNSFLSLTVRL